MNLLLNDQNNENNFTTPPNSPSKNVCYLCGKQFSIILKRDHGNKYKTNICGPICSQLNKENDINKNGPTEIENMIIGNTEIIFKISNIN